MLLCAMDETARALRAVTWPKINSQLWFDCCHLKLSVSTTRLDEHVFLGHTCWLHGQEVVGRRRAWHRHSNHRWTRWYWLRQHWACQWHQLQRRWASPTELRRENNCKRCAHLPLGAGKVTRTSGNSARSVQDSQALANRLLLNLKSQQMSGKVTE